MRRFWNWCSADFFSPKDFVRHAVLVLIVFGVVHLCGLREYTSILNGTVGSLNVDTDTAVLLGFIYLLAYLAAILLSPIFVLAALISFALQKKLGRKITSHEP